MPVRGLTGLRLTWDTGALADTFAMCLGSKSPQGTQLVGSAPTHQCGLSGGTVPLHPSSRRLGVKFYLSQGPASAQVSWKTVPLHQLTVSATLAD